MDYAAKRALSQQLEILRCSNRAVLLATHDIEFVAMVADRVLVLNEGAIVRDGNPVDLLSAGKELASQVAEVTGEEGLITIGQVIN